MSKGDALDARHHGTRVRKALHCSGCGARLSAPLAIMSGKEAGVVRPTVRDRQPLVARGTVFKSWTPQHWFYSEPGHQLHFAPQYWLNPDDLTEVVKDTHDRKRQGGCCGETGMNGPNKICRCGADVGTWQDDCMTPKVFIPEPSATEWRDGDGDDWTNP